MRTLVQRLKRLWNTPVEFYGWITQSHRPDRGMACCCSSSFSWSWDCSGSSDTSQNGRMWSSPLHEPPRLRRGESARWGTAESGPPQQDPPLGQAFLDRAVVAVQGDTPITVGRPWEHGLGEVTGPFCGKRRWRVRIVSEGVAVSGARCGTVRSAHSPRGRITSSRHRGRSTKSRCRGANAAVGATVAPATRLRR